MRTLARVLLFTFLLLSTQTALAEEKAIMVSLTQPLIVEQKTPASSSVFADLTEEAIQWGLDQVQLIGSTEWTEAENGYTRLEISWHTVANAAGKRERISSPLLSRVSFDLEKIEVGTKMAAKGNIRAVVDALNRLRKGEQDEKQIEKGEKDKEQEPLAQISPSSGGGGADGSWFGDSDSDKLNTDLKNTSYETCPDFISEGDKTVYEQRRTIITGESGTIYQDGACENTGQTWPISTRIGDCGVRVDFTANKAIQMEQSFYTKGTDEIKIGECKEGLATYDLYDTAVGCDVKVDQEAGVAIPTYRKAYKIGGTEFTAQQCTARDGDPLPLVEEICEERFEHDFINGVSYEKTRKYYDWNGERVYVNQCTRSTKTFSHKHIETGWTMDDDALVGKLMAKTVIEVDGGELEIKAPAAIQTVPYTIHSSITKQTAFAKTTEWTPPAKTIYTVTLIAGGCSGGYVNESGNNNYATKGGGEYGGNKAEWKNGSRIITASGGGASGELVTQPVEISELTPFTITIGNSDQDSAFGEYLTARSGWGNKGGDGKIKQDIFGLGIGGDGAEGFFYPQLPDFKPATAGESWSGTTSQCPGCPEKNISSGTPGKAGAFYGAGGGGSGSPARANSYSINNDDINSGGRGASGYCQINWSETTYRRPDGTVYDPLNVMGNTGQ